MKKYFQFKNNKVASFSDAKIICNKLEQKEIDITTEELDKIKTSNYNLFIKDNKLKFEEKENFKIQKEKEQEIQELKLLIEKAKEKYSDLAPLLEKLNNK